MKCKVLNAFLVICLCSAALYGCTLKSGSNNSEKKSTSKEITQTTVQSAQSPNVTEIPRNWQGMGHGMRVQGVIVKVDKDASTIKSLSLKVTNNLLYSGNPVDYDFKGEVVDVSFENGITDSDFIRQIKNGVSIAITFSQVSTSEGKIIYGSNPDFVYLVQDGLFTNLQGKNVKESELRPGGGKDQITNNNIIVPVATSEPTKVEPKIQNQVEGLVLNTPITAISTKGSIFIASDNNYSNLWVLTTDAPHPFFDISVYKDTFDKVQEKNNKEGRSENKLYLIRAAHPFPLSQERKIVFESNNSSILAGIYNSSLHVINSDGSEEKVLADSKIYGNLQIIGVTKDKVVANSANISNDPKNFGLTIVNLETGAIKLYMINGMAYALSEDISEDSKYVLFHKIKDSILLKENWMLDIETGKEKLAE